VDEPLYVLAPTINTDVTEAVFTPPRVGTYRFRITAKGRGIHADHVVASTVECYHLQFWPA
jgi:hypothetical protein